MTFSNYKQCRTCGETKPLSSFGIESRRPDGRRTRCRDCSVVFLRDYRNRAGEKYRESCRRYLSKSKAQRRIARIKRRYGISFVEYDALLTSQAGGCAICLTTTPGGRWATLGIDHCHRTGIVRGLLCNRCNEMLGRYNDDHNLFQRAADYLWESRHG